MFFAVMASSCTHYYYGPNTSNIPLLKEKNEGKLLFNYFVTDEASGVEFQSAYAVGKKTALMLNFANVASGGSLFSWGNNMNSTGAGTYIEGAAGYFAQQRPSNWVFETYTGLGAGTIRNTHDGHEKSKVNVLKFFVQPSIGWAGRNFEFGISSRMAYVVLNVKSSTVTELQNFEDYHDIENIRRKRSAFVLEPGIMIRPGARGIKFMLNFVGSVNLNRNWKQEEGGVSFGLCIPFNTKKS